MINSNSRYAQCKLYQGDQGSYWGMREMLDITPRYDDLFHTVVEGDRVEKLAYHYWGSALLWWIICDYNHIFFPLVLEIGTVLRIPSREHVQMRLIE